MAYFLKCIVDECSLIPELVNVAHFLRDTECEVFIEYLDAIIEWIHGHMFLSLKQLLLSKTCVINDCVYLLKVFIIKVFDIRVLPHHVNLSIVSNSLSCHVSHLSYS